MLAQRQQKQTQSPKQRTTALANKHTANTQSRMSSTVAHSLAPSAAGQHTTSNWPHGVKMETYDSASPEIKALIRQLNRQGAMAHGGSPPFSSEPLSAHTACTSSACKQQCACLAAQWQRMRVWSVRPKAGDQGFTSRCSLHAAFCFAPRPCRLAQAETLEEHQVALQGFDEVRAVAMHESQRFDSGGLDSHARVTALRILPSNLPCSVIPSAQDVIFDTPFIQLQVSYDGT